MKERKIRIVVLEDGKVVIDDLPVKKGQRVEVTLRIEPPSPPAYPLRGLPVRLIDPFLPVDESEWESSR